MEIKKLFLSGTFLLLTCRRIFFVLVFFLTPLQAQSGSYIFAGDGDEDWITHPSDYDPNVGGVVDIQLCIVPGSTNAAQLLQPVENTANLWSQLKPTTENRIAGTNSSGVSGIDIESVLIHEVGHCLGLGHPNMGSGYAESDATKSLAGNDSIFMLDGDNSSPNYSNGIDGLPGSADDQRGDDVNLHWYRKSNNNPFTIANVVDFSSYSLDLADLPVSDSYVSNADRDVASTYGLTNNSEAVMQQGSSYNAAQRQLGHDDVATILLASIGVDRTVGSGDDYQINVTSLGISDSSECDINIRISGSSFAYCSVGGRYLDSGHWGITSANIYLSANRSDWFFNSDTNGTCSASFALVDSQWSLISLPCATGIASVGSSTVGSVFGDDNLGAYGVDWMVFEWDATNESYTGLLLTDELVSHRGYWIKVIGQDATVTVNGQENAVYDIPLIGDSAAGRFNMVGHALENAHSWANACIIDSSGTLLTLDDVDPDLGIAGRACDQTPVDPQCRMSRTLHKWNGSSYTPYDGSTPGLEGSIGQYEGFWVEVFDSGLSLRLPSSNACVTSANSVAAASSELVSESATTVFSASNDAVEIEQPAEGKETQPIQFLDKGEWFIRLTANTGDRLIDADNVFGVLRAASDGFDQHDLKELAPFATPFLNLSFNQDSWGEFSGNYASDYRLSGNGRKLESNSWGFQVATSEVNETITLSWEGPKSVLGPSVLVDVLTGERIRVGRRGSYSFNMGGEGLRKFEWRVQPARSKRYVRKGKNKRFKLSYRRVGSEPRL